MKLTLFIQNHLIHMIELNFQIMMKIMKNENENIDNGIMKYENDIFYIKNNDNWNDILDKFIPHDYIIYKGLSYYIKIAQEFEYNFNTMISPTELLDFIYFKKIIKIEI